MSKSNLTFAKGPLYLLSLLLIATVILASCGGGAEPAAEEAPAAEEEAATGEETTESEETTGEEEATEGETTEEAPAAESADGEEKVLIVAIDGDIDTFDPCCTVGSKPTQTTLQNTFDQLTQYEIVERELPNGQSYLTVNTDNIIGMLAEDWTMDDSGLITFNLRDGITWHNGEEITAENVVSGYNRIFEVQGNASFLLSMGGVNDASQMEVVDDTTLTMTPEVPNMLVNMNNVMHNTSVLAPGDIEANAIDGDPFATELSLIHI